MTEKNVLDGWETGNTKTDKKMARKFVWKTRLSISLTVVRTIAIITLLYFMYTIPLHILYDTTHKQAAFDRMVTTLIEMKHPGLTISDDVYGPDATINALLTQKTKLTLVRHVGDWDVNIGHVTAKKYLFGKVHYTLHMENKFINNDSLINYAVPSDLIGKKETPKGNSLSSLFDQLEKIDDGYVVQVHFSTTKGMKPAKLLKLLQPYDVHTLEMPVYAGEIKDFHVGYGKSGQFTFIPSLILRPMVNYNDKSMLDSRVSWLDKQTLDESVDHFYDDLNWLVKQGHYDTLNWDKKRIKYLKKHGLKVFGATITGPIREIEKLKDMREFRQFYLNGMEVWNWEKERS